jgi:hypothetical protein
MSSAAQNLVAPFREQLLHGLYEAAELEHNLMCTYLYAAFSLKQGEAEGLTAQEADAVERWRRAILDVAIEEMGHVCAVWNITAAIGGAPRFGRTNFPLDPGYLPAGVVVKLAPFNEATLQHFIHLERPEGSGEPDGEGFPLERTFLRAIAAPRLTPMGIDYATVGEFYAALGAGLRGLVAQVDESAAFCGDRALQLSENEIDLGGVRPVVCLKTALAAFDAIVLQGEGAPRDNTESHFAKFVSIRSEYRSLKERNPSFVPAHPAATNPVLRRPPRPEGRVWLEDSRAAAVVDLANAAYGLMLRFIGYSYAISGPAPRRRWSSTSASDSCAQSPRLPSARHVCRRALRIQDATPACRSPHCVTPPPCPRVPAPGVSSTSDWHSSHTQRRRSPLRSARRALKPPRGILLSLRIVQGADSMRMRCLRPSLSRLPLDRRQLPRPSPLRAWNAWRARS